MKYTPKELNQLVSEEGLYPLLSVMCTCTGNIKGLYLGEIYQVLYTHRRNFECIITETGQTIFLQGLTTGEVVAPGLDCEFLPWKDYDADHK